jgi:hypothetical protein
MMMPNALDSRDKRRARLRIRKVGEVGFHMDFDFCLCRRWSHCRVEFPEQCTTASPALRGGRRQLAPSDDPAVCRLHDVVAGLTLGCLVEATNPALGLKSIADLIAQLLAISGFMVPGRLGLVMTGESARKSPQLYCANNKLCDQRAAFRARI